MKRIISSIFYGKIYYVYLGSDRCVMWTKYMESAMIFISDESLEQFVTMFIKPRDIKYKIEERSSANPSYI